MVHSVASTEAREGSVSAGFWALTLGSIGVVFGDIGTSPLYAVREALAHAGGGRTDMAILGVVSLMALAQHAVGRRSALVFFLGICGAALFYGDGMITPAISVLSAAEGLTSAPGGKVFEPYVLPVAAAILFGLFAVQSRGTAAVGRFFGPITLVWFLVLAALGLMHIVQEPSILRGLS